MSSKAEWEDPLPPEMSQSPPKESAIPVTQGRLSVTMPPFGRKVSAMPSTVSGYSQGKPLESKRSATSAARPARVFWDLESCPIGGRDYLPEIMRSIESRVSSDIKTNVFEICAVYGGRTSLPMDIRAELQAYDVNFFSVDHSVGEDQRSQAERRMSIGQSMQEAADNDLFEQIERFVTTQQLRTSLYPYVLLITGSVNLLNRMVQLEKQAKVVYALRKERVAHYAPGKIGFDYSPMKGIDNLHV